jgi:hypothetical protein
MNIDSTIIPDNHPQLSFIRWAVNKTMDHAPNFLTQRLKLLFGGLFVLTSSGCIGLLYTQTHGIGTISTGEHTHVSFQARLPKSGYSWEVGLWPVSGSSTNLSAFFGRQLTVRITNLGKEDVRISPGVLVADRPLLVLPSKKTVTVLEGTPNNAAQVHSLFGCDTDRQGASLLVELDFSPAVKINEPVNLGAHGRDAL